MFILIDSPFNMFYAGHMKIWKPQELETSNKFICSRAAMFLRNLNAVLNLFSRK